MLESLFGSKNMQKILIFLFVNGKCYGTQLHRLLKTSLTPLQKALQRLEKGGIIISGYEGKTRLYQFNPAFPVLEELEQLLKKAYTLLSADEKKNYFVAQEDDRIRGVNGDTHMRVLFAFWERLVSVSQVSINAQSKSKEEMGWNGKGNGDVIVTRAKDTEVIFQEKGSWRGKQGGEISFSNVFRWTLDRSAGVISLEHLRRGLENPVFLFHLAPTSSRSLSSIDSHLCGGDIYFGKIFFDKHSLRLNWRVIGPKKNEEIDYYYS